MMHSTFPAHAPGALPFSHPHDTFLDDVSNQTSVSQATRRSSRGSSGQRSGSAMRVSKPSSASNSPRSTTMINRRRTMIGDSQMLRRPQQLDYLSAHRNDMGQPTQRPARPVSWHPSTYLQPPHLQYQLQQQPIYPLSTPNMYTDQHDGYFSQPHFSPMMTSYSNNTSPSSTFSPLPLGYSAVEPSQYPASDGWDLPHKPTHNYATNDYQNVPEMFPNLNTPKEQNIPSHGLDWNSFIMHGFSNTSPPTPEAFLQARQSQPAVSEDAVPYQPLEEPEEEGEILVGMGLYDAPEKCGEDPQLNNYRTTVSSLLGSTFHHPEPRGKGLTLEETWEPPKSEDEDEDSGSEDESEDDK